MTADEYNHAELVAGRLTMAHVSKLVEYYQRDNGNLLVDGKFGPSTRRALEGPAPVPAPSSSLGLKWPLPALASGFRLPQVTSGFRTSDRPKHDGVDLFYRWQPGDLPDTVGDKLGAGVNAQYPGKPKWVVPYFVSAQAAAAGVVQIAGNSPTGYRCWIDHGNGWRTGYFHLTTLRVRVGDHVDVGQALGYVGDNPADHDGRHLHFELSPVDKYQPHDPEPHLPR